MILFRAKERRIVIACRIRRNHTLRKGESRNGGMMNKELMEALDVLEKEKEISKETLFEAIENS